MLEYNTALDIILSSAFQLPAEKVELHNAVNRVLAEDIFYDTDMPPFNKSAMDGYACRTIDLHHTLEIIETVYAGKQPQRKLQEKQCYKIMTGAVVPKGADCVFKKEDAELVGNDRVLCKNLPAGSNICYQGEDVKKGAKVLETSTRITSKHLPLLAGAGAVTPLVYKQPQVVVFATGTELVEPSVKPLSYQIRNTNSSQLLAQLAEVNVKSEYGGIIKDDESALAGKIAEALKYSQVIILTGGVSVGDYDLIPDVLANLGFSNLVTATAIQPGKPMLFATNNEKYCFGLSGNPVSSFIQAELYVKPFLLALMGNKIQPAPQKFTLGKELRRSNAGRLQFIPGILSPEMEVYPVEFHGSAHINALAGASCLIEFPKGTLTVNKGETVYVRSI